MKKYRRIEVNAFRRRVTIVSGEWPREVTDAQPPQTDDGVSLNDSDLCEPVEPDSPEGQLLLVEAVRSLERRLSPEARATIRNSSKDSHCESEEFKPRYRERTMTMKKIISLEKKSARFSFRPHLALTLLVGGMLALVITQAPSTHAQKYSDWSAPVNLGPVINSSFSDQGPAISKDGLTLYFHSNRPGGLGGFDMYVSKRASADDPWSPPMNLGSPVNTAFDEGNPAFSRDGHSLFFQSIRPSGLGGIDLWVSTRIQTHDDFNWEPAVNLGPGVNSTADDNAPSYFENDELNVVQLYFVSSRPGGFGGQDIYLSNQMPDGSFGPAALVTTLSSPSTDSRPSIRHDGLEIFFQSNRPGTLGLALDLWTATRESALDAWSTPVNLGSAINTASIENNANLSSDRLTLFFSSDRPGGFGGLDLYMTTRTKLRGQSGE